jgi:His-Xaa-Ser system radical SAM maturase HxsB
MARPFLSPDTFDRGDAYKLLPFRFAALDERRELISTDWGDWTIVERGTAARIAKRQLSRDSDLYRTLRAKQIVFDDYADPLLDVAATKLRTKKDFLSRGPSLHLFVVTLRCEHTCAYCQVSRQTTDRTRFDMSRETASRGIDLMLASPARHLTLEFQGGEPLLAFDMIRFIVEEAEARSVREGKTVQPVVATNLAVASDEILVYCRDHRIQISTSLDGPAWLHNQNRPRPGNNSYELTIEGIRRARDIVGPNSVSALMTTTRLSLDHPIEIVDEYVTQGFHNIFLRPISPYGFAVKSQRRTGYDIERYFEFYRRGLDYIIEMNRNGIHFVETYARILLTKMLTPFSTGYVDLDSPSGAVLRACVYNYDGDVYASDESRMLREMGDQSFRIGNVHTSSYSELFGSDQALGIVSDGTAEALPGCSDCALQPFCGGDPVFHHATQGTTIGHRPSSEFCKRNTSVLKYLFDRLDRGDRELEEIVWSWIHELPRKQLMKADASS